MQKIIWEVEYLSYYPVIKHCKKCGKKTNYICSKSFRVNCQRKYLDIWLIYKCSLCDTTWNLAVYSRINSKSIDNGLLDKFYSNDEKLVEQYALDKSTLIQNGVDFGVPDYQVTGKLFDLNKPVKLHILSSYPSNIKIISILSNHLHISQSSILKLYNSGQIECKTGNDLKRCKLMKENILVFNINDYWHKLFYNNGLMIVILP